MTVGCPPSDYTALGSNHRRLSAPARLVGRSLRRASYYALRCGRPTSGYPQYISLGIHFRCCALSLKRSGQALRLGDGVLTALSKGHHGNIYKGAGLPTGGSQMPPGTKSRDPRPKNTGTSGPPNCHSVEGRGQRRPATTRPEQPTPRPTGNRTYHVRVVRRSIER